MGFDPRSSYIGWIPSITLRLSFSNVGRASPDGRFDLARVVGPDGLVLSLSAERRNLHDNSPRFLGGSPSVSIDGRFTFVSMFQYGGKNDPDWLIGEVAVVDHASSNRLAIERQAELLIGRYREGMPPTDLPDFNDDIPADWEYARDLMRRRALFVVCFAVHRTGVVLLRLMNEKDYCAFALRREEIDYEDEGEGEEQVKISRVYHFIRDIAHLHQHHSEEDDSVIDAYPLSEDGRSWTDKVLRGLWLKAHRLRRSRQPEEVANSIGIIAYARSFSRLARELPFLTSAGPQSSCQTVVGFIPKRPFALAESIKFSELETSLNAAKEFGENLRETSRRRIDLIRNWLLVGIAALALVTRLAGSQSPTKTNESEDAERIVGKPSRLNDLAFFVNENLLLFVIAIIILVLFGLIWSDGLNITNNKLGKGVIRYLVIFQRKTAIAIAYSLSFLLLTATIIMLAAQFLS